MANSDEDILNFFTKSTPPEAGASPPENGATYTLENGTEHVTRPWKPNLCVGQAYVEHAADLSFEPHKANAIFKSKGALIPATAMIQPNTTYSASATAESKG